MDIDLSTCPECGDSFDDLRGCSAHYAAAHDGPHILVAAVGADRLAELYAGASEHDVADELGVSQVTVHNALQTLDVDTSNPQHHDHPVLRTDDQHGYEYVAHKNAKFLHHRLAAVAWFGWSAVVGKVVHHENGIEWDNREENMETMTQSDHIHEHDLPYRHP